MGAIQYLNSYYMGQQLQQEDDFVSKCMFHLSSAAERLISKSKEPGEASGSQTTDEFKEKPTDNGNIYESMTEDAALQCIQRALLLLKTHLDTFKRRYLPLQLFCACFKDADAVRPTSSYLPFFLMHFVFRTPPSGLLHNARFFSTLVKFCSRYSNYVFQ